MRRREGDLVGRRVFVRRLAGLGVSAAGFAALGCDMRFPSAAIPAKVRRIGYLSVSSREASRPFFEALLDGLRQLGWVEGENLMIEWRFADGRSDMLLALAGELVEARAELIVTQASNQATTAVQQQTSTIPIVAVNMTNPVEMGLVASLARPGGNTTGIANQLAGGFTKMVELLKGMVPSLSHVAFMLDMSNPTYAPTRLAVRETALALTLQVLEVDVRSAPDLEGAFATATGWGANGHLFVAQPALTPVLTRTVDLATHSGLPGAYNLRDYVEAGGLMSYSSDARAVFKYAASHVNKILNGANTGDLPVEYATTLELLVNTKTAQALGLTVPPDVASQVTEWVQ